MILVLVLVIVMVVRVVRAMVESTSGGIRSSSTSGSGCSTSNRSSISGSSIKKRSTSGSGCSSSE